MYILCVVWSVMLLLFPAPGDLLPKNVKKVGTMVVMWLSNGAEILALD